MEMVELTLGTSLFFCQLSILTPRTFRLDQEMVSRVRVYMAWGGNARESSQGARLH